VSNTPVPCPEILLRAITKAGWIDQDTGEIDSGAYIGDPARDLDELSVNIAQLTDTEEWLSSFRASFGADSLHTGHVRSLGIDVVQTAEDLASRPSHALIVGVPSQEQDALAAERLASSLQHMSRAVDRKRRKQPK
jgi:hypothetical protein